MASTQQSQPQTNGASSSSAVMSKPTAAPTSQAASTSFSATSASGAASATTNPNPNPSSQSQGPLQTQPQLQSQPPATTTNTNTTAADPRPRDARLVELLLTSQGVTAYEQRVPLLLLDFAYRHTSSVLCDALHLSGDPHVSHAGSKPAASSGAIASAPGEAAVTANAVKLAISARLSYQFRGGGGGGGSGSGSGPGGGHPGSGGGVGGVSKEYMQELARERNKITLPKIVPNEWGVRLPSERFVLSGTSWGLKGSWEGDGISDDDDDDEDDEMDQGVDGIHHQGQQHQSLGDAMEGIQGPDPEDVGGDGVEGGTVEDVFGDDVDEEMAEDG